MKAVLGVTRSVLGQAWCWRGGVMPGDDGLTGSDDSALLHHLFRARGADPADFVRLATPTLRDWLPDPAIFRDMEAAAGRIADAVERGEAIVVFGDYDVDGATSAAVLIRVLRALGGVVSHYIPDRLLEGYGPSADALVALRAAGADLVVTVDCGTQGFEALAAARDAGLPVIVVDHHKAMTALPCALALVNPNRCDESPAARGFGHLAAVGMAFLLAVALNRTLRQRGWFTIRAEPRLLDLLDIVALGTVADVVPLTGLNRAFVTQGLKVMATRRNAGIAALCDVASLGRAPLARDLGFVLGPRVNAGGRVGRADLGVRLLTTEDADEAVALAAELDRFNLERRAIEAEVTAAALAAASGDAPVAVVAGEGWHPGVIGIAAARVKERLNRPAIVIALLPDGTGKGSGRSLPGVDLGTAVLAAKEAGLISAGGGHAMAAGLTVPPGGVPALAAFLADFCAAEVAAATRGRTLACDTAVTPRGVCVALCDALTAAGPYGQGWSPPRIAAGPFRLVDCRIVGEHHVRAVLAGDDGARVKAIAWRAADTPLGAALMAAGGRRLHVAGRVNRNEWQGQISAELELDDIAWTDG